MPARRAPRRTAPPRRPWERPWKPELAHELGLRWVVGALLPGLSRRGRWVGRLGPRGLALFVVARTGQRYATSTYVLPRLHRLLDDRLRWRAELVEQLGREPTEAEERAHQRRRWRDEHPEPSAAMDAAAPERGR